MFKHFSHIIYDHPGITGLCGSITAFTFSMINISGATEMLKLTTEIIKLIGVSAGSIVAVASLLSFIKKMDDKEDLK